MKILGLCGYAGSGKDAAAGGMAGWIRKAFADELKRMASSMLEEHAGITPDWRDPAFKKAWRYFLVGLGAGMRSQQEDYWIERMEEEVRWARDNPDSFGCEHKIVVTDVRYPNECRWITEQGGKIVLIVRPGIEPANPEERDSIQAIKDTLHPQWVLNDGTPEKLASRILTFY